MESAFRAAFLLMLVTAAAAQNDHCRCPTNVRAFCDSASGSCICTAFGSNQRLDCSTLTSKCLLMKAESNRNVPKAIPTPEHGFLDNDGLYDPDCEASGIFKARQCNKTDTCWCVNSAGVRRTDKGDINLRCSELVRTNQISIHLKHKERQYAFSESDVANSLQQLIQNRYMLHQKFIPKIEYDSPFIQIVLLQNISQKSYGDVDIADVAYYFEKDIKGDPIFLPNDMFNLSVNEEPLDIEEILIYYVDEKPPEFTMKRLTAGVISVVVVVILAIVIGITVLVITRRRKTGKYEKVEIKEMGVMRRGQNA